MSTNALMDVEEYLRTSFDGQDYEYLDGEVVERNWADFPHAETQGCMGRKPNIEIPLQAAFDLDS